VTGFALAAALAAAAPPPLFAEDSVISLSIEAPFEVLVAADPEERPTISGTMRVAASGEALAVQLQPRGITRRRKDICQFPPLRVSLSPPAPAASLFAGQRRLKLVTHCQGQERFQQNVLLEYAAYRLYNALTPASFRVRLARIDYRDGASRTVSRYGFFIEDSRDLAARNGMIEPAVGERFPVTRLAPTDAARFALFEYMIGNLDWAMQAGPPGDRCCHNSSPITPGGAAPIVPVPYDFDFSGLVSAPYATPPPTVPVSSVRQRRYRGLCRHNAEARALLPSLRAFAPTARQTIESIPGLDGGSKRRAIGYLDGFFRGIASDEQAEKAIFATCLGQN
jgi:hypothetical protein